ncbi:hypothetical protein JCM24511_01671 [Saitozyma sp. JCM 24511]|nr:hypothetical protein JCM24511_01671 [Saitozyma sp. JCM 24511]
MTRLAALGLVALVLPELASALWPFKQKRFSAEALIDAGPVGLEDIAGRVAAVGDWNGDQNSDLFVLSQDGKSVQVHLWDRDTFRYKPSSIVTVESTITNVVPGDFNHDGRLDLLVMYESDEGWWPSKKESTGMQVFLGRPDGGIDGTPWKLSHSTEVQAMVFDADGSLRPSLLGFAPGTDDTTDAVLRAWINNGSGMALQAPPLQDASQACSLASPHSSAFVDINGDCLPDLVLHCTRPRSSHHSIQIWTNRGPAGFALARSYDLPRGSGPLTFADMNRDGSLDIVFPTCDRHSTSTGVGFDCKVNIAYNRQVPACGTEASQYKSDQSLKCRGWGELCVADDSFEFSFDSSSEYFTSVPFSSIFDGFSGSHDLLLHPPGQSTIPLPLRAGDYNVDGYPDLLLTISNTTAAPGGGPFGGRRGGTQVRVLENVPCKSGVAGCDTGTAKRGLRVGSGKGWEVLDEIWDAQGASWLDLDDDGSLDIMVQRSGGQASQRVTFVQNNFYHDAFFLKAQVLNGACDGDCQPADGGKKYSPLGVSYSGATYKFTVLDTLGRRGAQQVAQLPQTAYHALGTPYAFVGLGRTNNYRISVGASLYPPGHTTYLESIVPNSQLLINPPSPADNDSHPPVRARSAEWRSELYLHPGDWVPWVGAAVVGMVIILGGVVLGLHEREKKEDEKERRRALHAINFQAL